MSIFSLYLDDFFSDDMTETGLFLKDNRPVKLIITTKQNDTTIGNITIPNGKTLLLIKSTDIGNAKIGDIIHVNGIDWIIENIGISEDGINTVEVGYD